MALTYTAQLVDMLALRKPLSKSGLQGICKNMSTQTHVCSPFINDFWYMWVVGGGSVAYTDLTLPTTSLVLFAVGAR